YSLRGYQYCDLLLAQGDHTAARDRSSRTLEWQVKDSVSLLDIALTTLTLGRAHLGLALDSVRAKRQVAAARDYTHTARACLHQAVDALLGAGQTDYIPCGLLARAAFRRCVGDWSRAGRDLDEVEEIAEPG